MISQAVAGADRSAARIRRTILLALAFTFIAIVAVRSLSLWSQYDETMQAGRERAQNLALMIGDHFVRSIESIDGNLIQISNYVSRTRSAPGFTDDLTPMLTQSLSVLRGVGSISVVDEHGKVTHSTVPQIVGANRKDRFAFERMQSDPNTQFVTDIPFHGLISKQLLIPLARRIESADRAFGGIVVATLEPERLREFYQAVEIGKKGVIWLLHPEGFVLLRQPSGSEAGDRLPADHPLRFQATPHDGWGASALRMSIDGSNYITAVQQYTNLAARVAVSISEEELLRDWWRDLRNSLIIVFCTGFALAFAAFQISRQIKERQAETEKFVTASRQFQDILDHAPVTITVKGRDGRLVLANREFQRRVNRTPEQMVGRSLKEILPEQYAGQLAAIDEEVLKNGIVVQRELISPEPRNYLAIKFPLFGADGKVDAVGSISQDITDAKAAQTINLRIFEKSIDLILVTDSKGQLIRVSPSVYAILGYRPEEVEGRNAIEFIHPDDLEPTREEMRLARRGLVSRDFHSRYLHKDGRTVGLSWTGMWAEEEKQHFFIGHDLSERMKLEQALRQSQKMEAIGQLTGGLAHDYNNLLTVILGNAELLTESLQSQPALLPLAQATVDAADRSAVLTQRLLAFGRRQALDARPTNLNQLLTGMMDLVRVTAGEQIRIDLVLGTDPWTVKVDRGQLETAMLNLVANARDAMQKVGTLRIETARASFDEEAASISPEIKTGNFTMLAVSDTGSGMSPETLSRVFEPFFTTKETGKGTGLGLSMVYGFVKQSGGHISIYSEPGIGTSVKLYFPPVDREIAQQVELESVRDELLTGSESVLLVEDEPLVRANTERQLVLLGYNVVTASNGKEALALFENGLRPDLLLSDVIMAGGINGRELAEHLCEQCPGLRVLFMSGYTSGVLADGDSGIPEGTNFIGKPFRRSQLAKAIREALDSEAPVYNK
jgi:PAS domain S-box-containing protein